MRKIIILLFAAALAFSSCGSARLTPEEQQARLREINSEIAAKTQKIGNNILAESNAFKEKFGTPVSSYTSEMTSCEDRARREEMFKAYSSRGNNGN